MTTFNLQSPALARPRATGVLRLIPLALSAWRSRRVLARLDDRALADIGLERCEAFAEASRPIWDISTHMRG